MKKISIISLLAILLASCASPTPTPNPAGNTRPALTDPAQPIEVQAGEMIHIVVDSNPSTGYHWEIIGPLDDAHLEFVSREYVGSEPALPGSGGVEVWTFKAVAPGESILVLGNYPPSESESYEEEVRFSIVVE